MREVCVARVGPVGAFVEGGAGEGGVRDESGGGDSPGESGDRDQPDKSKETTMRLLFFAAAAAHAVLVAILFTASVDVMLLSGIGVVVTLVTGVVGLVRKGIGAGMWAGAVAGLVALLGWGSWLLVWATDPDRNDPVINVWGILLPGLAVIVYLVAAVLPSSAGRKAR